MTRRGLHWPLASLLVLLLAMPVLAKATPGNFRGVLVENPAGDKEDGVVYLRAKNGMVRKVEISKAAVEFDSSVPAEKRTGTAKDQLKPGTDVRVTAEQSSDGEWHASRIDIMGQDNSMQSTTNSDDSEDPNMPEVDDSQGKIRRI